MGWLSGCASSGDPEADRREPRLLLETRYPLHAIARSPSGRIFLGANPRSLGTPFWLAEMDSRRLVPYPDLAWNRPGSDPSLADIVALRCDEQGVLWVLDADARLFAFDLRTDRLLAVHELSEEPRVFSDLLIDRGRGVAFLSSPSGLEIYDLAMRTKVATPSPDAVVGTGDLAFDEEREALFFRPHDGSPLLRIPIRNAHGGRPCSFDEARGVSATPLSDAWLRLRNGSTVILADGELRLRRGSGPWQILYPDWKPKACIDLVEAGPLAILLLAHGIDTVEVWRVPLDD